MRGLIYPVPDPAFPFLGIHTTVRPDGAVWLGPNAVLALSREGYRRRDVSLRDLRETLRSAGFRRLARRHWRMGAAETVRDLSHPPVRRRGPEAPAGARRRRRASRAVGDQGAGARSRRHPLDDFVFHEAPGVVHVRNAPSPGATSSLAIASVIADRVEAAASPNDPCRARPARTWLRAWHDFLPDTARIGRRTA